MLNKVYVCMYVCMSSIPLVSVANFANRSFPSPKTLITFKTRLSAKTFCKTASYLHEKKKSFSYQWLRIYPHFETVGLGNPEMGYL